MKNKLMLFVAIVFAIGSLSIVADNKALIALAKHGLNKEKKALNLTKDEKAILKKFQEDKEQLKNCLDVMMKNNLSAIADGIRAGALDTPEDALMLFLLSIGREERILLVDLGETHSLFYKECLKNKNIPLESCDRCLLALFFQNAEFALDYAGLEVLNAVTGLDPHPYNEMLAEER